MVVALHNKWSSSCSLAEMIGPTHAIFVDEFLVDRESDREGEACQERRRRLRQLDDKGGIVLRNDAITNQRLHLARRDLVVVFDGRNEGGKRRFGLWLQRAVDAVGNIFGRQRCAI